MTAQTDKPSRSDKTVLSGNVSEAAASARDPGDELLAKAGRLPSSNPLLAAAGGVVGLLALCGKASDRGESPSLIGPLSRMVEAFEAELARGAVPSEEARIARYVLCETIDDVIAYGRAADAGNWMKSGMLSRYFNLRAAGSGFFDALNRALQDPKAHAQLLELIQVCLALGFKGQYRTVPLGDETLSRIAADVHASLRYARGQAPQRLSPQAAVARLPASRFHQRPIVMPAAAACIALVAGTFLLAWNVANTQTEAVAAELHTLIPAGEVVIVRHERGSSAAGTNP